MYLYMGTILLPSLALFQFLMSLWWHFDLTICHQIDLAKIIYPWIRLPDPEIFLSHSFSISIFQSHVLHKSKLKPWKWCKHTCGSKAGGHCSWEWLTWQVPVTIDSMVGERWKPLVFFSGVAVTANKDTLAVEAQTYLWGHIHKFMQDFGWIANIANHIKPTFNCLLVGS